MNVVKGDAKDPAANSAALTGAAGVYFVAARLNAMGFQCAPTFGNVPGVDILVSNLRGSALVSIQEQLGYHKEPFG